MRVSRFSTAIASTIVALGFSAAQVHAAPVSVLWYDATPEYGGQSTNAMRQAFANSLNAVNGGSSFAATYVDAYSAGQGSLATALAANNYSVVFIDDTGGNGYNAADRTALQNFYAGHRNLLLDGSMYIRNINYNAETVYPGPGGAMEGFTINEANALASRGGGIFFGTDHNCCQSAINNLLASILPGAAFSGIAAPNVSGAFYGNDLLSGIVPIAAANVLAHWASEGTQGIPPKGSFTDFLGNAVELFVQADFPISGTRYQFVTSSWSPGSGSTAANDTTTGGTAGGGGTADGSVPVPSSVLLLAFGLAGILSLRKRV